MAKVTNFLSIVLLVSAFVVAPAFATSEPQAGTAPAAGQQSGFGASVITPVLGVADKVNPFNLVDGYILTNHQALSSLIKYVTVISLVATNPSVQSAFNSFVSSVQNAIGLAADDSDEDTTEPARLVIGRKA